MRYTEEEMRERRLAVEAARAEKEAKKAAREQKRLASIERRRTREEMKAERERIKAEVKEKINRQKGINMYAEPKQDFTMKQRTEVKEIVRKELEEKVFRPVQMVQTLSSISADNKIYRKFTCDELIKIFGGWFTLRYLFSVQSETEVSPLTGKPIETDFYVCSQDVSHMRVNERPPYNEVLHKQFGVDVYGFCIVAPSTAF